MNAVDTFLARYDAPAPIAKDTERTYRALHRIMDRWIPSMRSKFLRAITETQSETTRAAVARALDRGDIDGALRAIPWEEVGGRVLESGFMRDFRDVFDQAGIVSARIIRNVKPFDFAVTDPRGLEYIQRHGAELVREIGTETRMALRETLGRMLDRGLSSNATAKLIVEQIGLTRRMATAVENYRARLVENGTALGRAGDQAQAYARKLRLYRANMVARTEAQFAVSGGEQNAWDQAADRGLFNPRTAEVEWVTAADEIVCPTCGPMDGQRVGFGEAFTVGDGTMVSAPPVHPHCRCARELVV